MYVPDVEYILVDPSCSGSGMTNRLFNTIDKDPDRLANLTGLQSRMLAHAMRAFTKAKKIVYSTCSIYPEENEKVVQECLGMCPDWELIKPLEFSEQWKHFGSPKFKHIGKKCIYSRAEIDLTDGFFVAIFERNLDPSKVTEYDPNDAFLRRIEWNLRPKFSTQTMAEIVTNKPAQEVQIDLTEKNGKTDTTSIDLVEKQRGDGTDAEVTRNEKPKKKKSKTDKNLTVDSTLKKKSKKDELQTIHVEEGDGDENLSTERKRKKKRSKVSEESVESKSAFDQDLADHKARNGKRKLDKDVEGDENALGTTKTKKKKKLDASVVAIVDLTADCANNESVVDVKTTKKKKSKKIKA